MDQYIVERYFVHIFHTGEYHTNNPEEDDVIASDQCACRIEVFQIFCFIGPAQCGERPQRGAEPCIQSIFILMQFCAAAFFTFIRSCFAYSNMTAFFTVVSRNTVAPPQLTGDTPVTDIFQPVHVYFTETIGNKTQFLLFIYFHSRFCQFVHAYKPLQFDQGFDGNITSFMAAYCMSDIFDFYQIALFFQVCYYCFSGFHTIHACVFACFFVHSTIVVHYVDTRQVMTYTNFKVVRVVSRCNFYNTGTEFTVNIFITYDGDFFIHQRQDTCFADEVLITFVIRMNRNSNVAHHCFGTSCCQTQSFIGAYNGIFNVVEMTCCFHMVNFRVRNGSLTFGAPVDDLFTTIDIAFFIQTAEYFQNGVGAAFVHGEAYAFPVTGAAQFPQLIQNDAAIFFFPSPSAFQETITAYIVFCQAFGSHFLYNFQFCGNTCVVNAGNPQCIVASHSFPTDQNILHGVVQCMAHMQLPSDVRGRHYDTIRFFAFIDFCVEIFSFHPHRIESVLYCCGIKILCQFSHVFSSFVS